MITLSEVPKKYPKLASAYEKETGYKTILINGNVSKGFTRWIQKKIKYKSLTCNRISKFFLKFLFKHSYFSTNTLVGIYHDAFHPQVDEHKSVRTKLKSLLRYHLKLGVLEKYGSRIYKVNKELLKEHYGNGEVIGES